jgi:hypothetical protein
VPGDGLAADEEADHAAGIVPGSRRVLVVWDAPDGSRAVKGRRAARVRCRDVQLEHAAGPEDPVVVAAAGHRTASWLVTGSKASPSGLAMTTV